MNDLNEIFTKLVKKHIYPIYKKDIKEYWHKRRHELTFNVWLEYQNSYDSLLGKYNTEILPYCCAVEEITADFASKREFERVLAIIACDMHTKKIIHFTTKQPKGYAKFLKYGFQVVDTFSGNHGKPITQLELRLPDDRPWLNG